MKELKISKFKDNDELTENICPNCGGRLYWGQVPCPDGKSGCLVYHQGYKCPNCGKYFTD